MFSTLALKIPQSSTPSAACIQGQEFSPWHLHILLLLVQTFSDATREALNIQNINCIMELPHQLGYGSFLLQLIKGRWMMAVVSFYILFCSGATYIFGIYSGAIKSALHYDQETIDTLSFFKDLGSNVGIVSGLLNEVLPSWVVLLVGAGMNLFGYLMIWLAVTHRIARPPIWKMNLFLCLGANSQTFANTGVLITFVKNFPQGRGEVLGIVKGCVGLSGAIFTQIYHAIYGQDSRGVILLIGWLPSLVTLLFMFFIRSITPVADKHEKHNIYSFLYLALLLAAFLMLAILLENILPFPSIAYKVMGTITVMLVIFNVVIGVRAEQKFMAQIEERQSLGGHSNPRILQELSVTPINPQHTSTTNVNHGTMLEQTEAQFTQEQAVKTSSPSRSPMRNGGVSTSGADHLCITRLKKLFVHRPERGEDFTIPQAIFSMDMLILFIALTCGIGATLTAIDNMGQIGESLGYSTVSISTCVSLISIWNFLGRVLAGFLSEILLRRYRFPRTLMLTIVLGLACGGHLMIAFPAPGTLYIASIVVGLCFGAQWPLLYAVISELFGLKYYATLYNVGGAASPLGSYLLNVRVAGHLYDREARRQQAAILDSDRIGAPSPTGLITCMGSNCFRLTFLIMTMVSAFGCLVSSLLVLRTKSFYTQDIYAKFRVNTDVDKSPDDQCESDRH